jgi:branched-chain amino acid transport system substrate-binding protein
MTVLRRCRALTMVAILCGVLSDGCGDSQQPQPGPIQLGGIFNLTGGQESLDIPSRNGAVLAVEQINAAGGVLGRRVELVTADGETDAAVLQARTGELVASGVAAMLGLSDTDAVLAAAPVAAEAQTFFVTSGATSPKLPAQVPQYLYLACFGDNEQAAAGAEYAASSLQARTAYLLLDSTTDYTVLLAGYFQDAFSQLGGTIVLSAQYGGHDGALDLSAQLAQLQSLGSLPDILYIAAGPDEITAIVPQIRAAGIDRPILGGDGYDTSSLLQLGAGADDISYTTHALLTADSADTRVRQFVADYQARYGTAPENAFAGLGYDTVELLVDAIRRAGSSQRAAIGAALASTHDLAGVTGTISYVDGSHLPRKTVAVVHLQDGKRELAAQFIPTHVPSP